MFQVTHFDPEAAEKLPERKRQKREPSTDHADEMSVKVIAPEHKPIRQSKIRRDHEEAFDDMDIVEDAGFGSFPSAVDQETLEVGNGLSRQEIQTAIGLSEMPMQEVAAAWRLAPFLLENLKRDGFESFFPIQALTIPDVIANERHPHLQAPTGSGKTLSYVLPILNSLANRQFRRLRALVVLPSRDLADQVYRVFDKYTQGSNLKVGLAVGQSDFKAEQIALTTAPDSSSAAEMRLKLRFDPGNLALALKAFGSLKDFDPNHTNQRTASPIDILVCTPGRLVDHLDSTPGFTLEHLRFVCIDEADRLLNQSYHNWFERVLAATHAMPSLTASGGDGDANRDRVQSIHHRIDPRTWRRSEDGDAASSKGYCQPVQLRKFLVSATLTRDPQKLAALHLVNPRHFDLHQLSADSGTNHEYKKYAMPSALEECMVECTAEQKPIVLLSLILDGMNQIKISSEDTGRSKGVIVVFTSSLESTHRLARLLQLLWTASGQGDASMIAEFSSSLSQKERASLIHRCKDVNDALAVVVCSDGMSRGMDIELVSTVINYDVPGFAKVYVHRCGRTARAGKKGTSITLLKGGQVGQFRKMRSLIQSPDAVLEKGIKKQLVRDFVPHYRGCVQALQKVLAAESEGDLATTGIESLHDFLSGDE